MARLISIMLLCLGLAGCGELVNSGNWPSNRTLGIAGGSLALDQIELTVPGNALGHSTTFKIIDIDEEAPLEGALGPVYRIHPEGVQELDATVTWYITVDDLPGGVYFIDLAVARAEDGADGMEWVPLAAPFLDPIAGVVRGHTDRTGVFALIQNIDIEP